MPERSSPLPFNPSVLTWARQRSGLSIEDAADALNVPVDKFRDWESGRRSPTVKQARNLAHLYGRPFLEFFAKTTPSVAAVALVPDFRFHREPPSEKEASALREVQEWAEEQRRNALSLLKDLGEEPIRIFSQLRFSVSDDVDSAAETARKVISFSIDAQLELKSQIRYQLPNILRAAIEKVGVLVLKRSDIGKLRTRGICLYADPMPVIVFGSEAPSAQAFTISHEFGHVLLGESGISGTPRFGKDVRSHVKAVESWCNRFAAAFLIPEINLRNLVRRPSRPSATFDDNQLSQLANAFAVSRHAMLIRLVNLGYVEAAFYWKQKRPVFLKEEAEYKGFARAPYYGSRYVNSNGRFYTSLVLDAWGSGRISSHNAAEFMGISNLEHLRDIRDNFGRLDA